MSFLLLAACSSQQTAPEEEAPELDYDLLLTLPDRSISYHKSVKPVLENRCVVCHGCYDAPCQLKLSSMAGLQRGASKERVYDGARILPAPPSRLFIDAKTTAEWREKAFYPVLIASSPTCPAWWPKTTSSINFPRTGWNVLTSCSCNPITR